MTERELLAQVLDLYEFDYGLTPEQVTARMIALVQDYGADQYNTGWDQYAEEHGYNYDLFGNPR